MEKLVKGPAIFDEDDQLYHVKIWYNDPQKTGFGIMVHRSATVCLERAKIMIILWEACHPVSFEKIDKEIDDILNSPENPV